MKLGTPATIGLAVDLNPEVGQDELVAALIKECEECGIPDRGFSPITDLIPNPDYDPEGEGSAREPWIYVFGRIPQCGKRWQGPESYILYDFDTGGSYSRYLSAEFEWYIKNLSDCLTGADLSGHVCREPPDNLVFDVVKQRWCGSYTLLGGTLAVEVFGRIIAGEERWFIQYKGCTFIPDPPEDPDSIMEFAISCAYPMRGTAGVTHYVGVGCCNDLLEPPSPAWGGLIQVEIQELIRPISQGIPIDVRPTDEPVRDVQANGDCCDVDCPLEPGCCNNPIWINAAMSFTLSDFTVECDHTLPMGCAVEDLVVSSTDTSGCVTWNVGLCLTSTICLQCDYDESTDDDNRGWQHYRLKVTDPGTGTITYFEPVDGSCDPFFLTFNVTQTLTATNVLDPTICTVTYTVTVLIP